MKQAFAHGITLNISDIVQATTKLSLMENKIIPASREEETNAKMKINLAQQRIAAFLQEPGTWEGIAPRYQTGQLPQSG